MTGMPPEQGERPQTPHFASIMLTLVLLIITLSCAIAFMYID